MSTSNLKETQNPEENGKDENKIISLDSLITEKGRPQIIISGRFLDEITDDVWAGILEFNDPKVLFRFGGKISRLEINDNGELIVSPLGKDEACELLARVFDWLKLIEKKLKKVFPNERVVRNFLATPNPKLPIIHRIVSAPILSKDGSVKMEEGYDPLTKTYISTIGFKLKYVPETPTEAELSKAKSLLENDLFGDFPFIDQASLCHMIALTLLPFVRSIIVGPTPIHLIDAPSPGTGKSLAADCATSIFCGRPVPGMAEARDEDEIRKRITAGLMASNAFFLFDNISNSINSGALAAAITLGTWTDRVLGKSFNISLPIQCAWVFTGNNLTMSNEIARRSILIRMDSGHEKPWLRDHKEFKHQLPKWAFDNRSDLVWACLTIIKNWFAKGCPEPNVKALGSFEDWSRVIGGILEAAGIQGFLNNLNELYERSNEESAVWGLFLVRWLEEFGYQNVSTSELLQLVDDNDIPLVISGSDDHGKKVSLAYSIRKQQGRIIILTNKRGEKVSVKINKGTSHAGSFTWHLEHINPNG